MNLSTPNFGDIGKSLRGLWDELVERRLWPVAIVLIVAVVAVPVLLSKPAAKAPPPPAPAPASAGSPLAAFQPAVSTEGEKSSEIRKNLRHFGQKNPFTPQGLSFSSSAGNATPTATATGTTGATATTTFGGSTALTGGDSTSTGASGGGTGTGTSGGTTGGTTQGTAGVVYYTYTVDVRFGKTGQAEPKTLTDFRALPGSDNPVVVFMGVRNDGETAVFLVSANATTTGDGDCKPSDDECTFLYMKKNDKRTIESVGTDGAVVSYDLELRNVNVKRTDGPSTANSSKASSRVSKSSRRAQVRQKRMRFQQVVHSLQTFGL